MFVASCTPRDYDSVFLKKGKTMVTAHCVMNPREKLRKVLTKVRVDE